MTKRRVLLLICCWIYFVPVLFGQHVKTVSGEYTYYPPASLSLDQAKQIAVHRAQIQILADNYGTRLVSTSTTNVSNSQENSQVDYFSLSESVVKGEWLETIGDPKFDIDFSEDGMWVIHVSVKGKIREINESKVDFQAKVLRNGVEDRFEGTDFKEGDDLYFSFIAPVDGYLSVYLYDGNEDVFCLLPYQNQTASTIKIQQDRRYVFFSCEHSDYGVEDTVVDEYTMTCERDMELNRMYVVWSTNPFFKTTLTGSYEGLPRYMAYSHFQKWLSKLRTQDNQSVVQSIDLTIRKK